MLHQFEHRDLCQLLGILHGRFVFSLPFIYLFNQSFYLHLYGLMGLYFVLWIITQLDFILLLKSSQIWPWEALSVCSCVFFDKVPSESQKKKKLLYLILGKDNSTSFHEEGFLFFLSLSLFFFFFSHALWHPRSQFLDQGPNLCPLQWKLRVLITGLPGRS